MPASRVRVVSIIEISHLTAMQSSLLADHDAFGWIIFTVLLLAFFLAARRLAVGIPLRTRPPVAPPPSLASGARGGHWHRCARDGCSRAARLQRLLCGAEFGRAAGKCQH